MRYSLLLLSLISYLVLSKCSNSQRNEEKVDKCKDMWRPEELIGKCFTMSGYDKMIIKDKKLKSIYSNITTAEACRDLCCDLNEKCITWQFEKTERTCSLGKIVRFGLEKTGTSGWCNPFPEIKWRGRELKSRNNGVCEWGRRLRKQCYGLGDPRLDSTSVALNTEQCAKACCEDKTCKLWQELPGHGCFYTHKTIKIKDNLDRFYTGGRKCVKGYCGGLESKLKALTIVKKEDKDFY